MERGCAYSGVYFFKCNGLVKIGRGKNVLKRFWNLQIGNPYRMEFIGYIPATRAEAIAIESEWHRNFGWLRRNGEWFQLDEALMRAIKTANPIPVHGWKRQVRIREWL